MFKVLGLLCLAAATVVGAEAAAQERREAVVSAVNRFQSARNAGDRRQALTEARRLATLAPDNPVLRTFMARAAAAAGDAALVRETLQWLASRGYGIDERARSDLAEWLGQEGDSALVRRLEANANPRGTSVRSIPIDRRIRSEGVTYDPTRDLVYLANADGLFAVGRDGSLKAVAQPDSLRDRSVLGVRYDPSHDRVFVCSSSRPGAENPTAELVILHMAEGARAERFALGSSPQQRLCNDIAVLADGAAITDTETGEVFRYRDGEGVSRLTETKFAYPNGIVQVGDQIIVADLLGLWALAPDGRLHGQMRTADDDYLGGMDGLAASGDTLIGVQNLTAPGRVVSFRTAGGLLLLDRRVLIAGAPELDGMTTAAVRGDRLLVVSGRPDAAGSAGRALVELRLD